MFVPPFLCPHIPLRAHSFTAVPLPFPPSCPMAPCTNGDKAHIQFSHRPHPLSQSLAFNLTRNPNPLISLPIHPEFLSSLLSLLHLSYVVCHFSKTLGSKLNLPFLIFRYCCGYTTWKNVSLREGQPSVFPDLHISAG